MNRPLPKAISLVVVLLLNASSVLAERREIQFPISDGLFSGHPSVLAFTPDGRIGFALVSDQKDGSGVLFSFSVSERKIIDEFDLKSDFGVRVDIKAPIILMKKDSRVALILLYGISIPDGIQKIVAVAHDLTGHLSKQWAISYTAGSVWPDVALNQDGSRIYVAHTSQQTGVPDKHRQARGHMFEKTSDDPSVRNVQHLDLVRSEDGTTLAKATLSDAGDDVSVVFDEVNNRVIALAGTSANLFTSTNDILRLEATIGPTPELLTVFAPVITQDCRFVIGYSGFTGDAAGHAGNKFVSYDLERLTSRIFFIEDEFFPGTTLLTFHRATGALLVPLSAGFKEEPDGSVTFSFTSSRQGHIIAVGSDGSLQQRPDVMLPKRSPGGLGRNVIGPFNNMTISPTGALGFVSTHSGRLISFDTLTGEIVND